jgi:hypothetical protein
MSIRFEYTITPTGACLRKMFYGGLVALRFVAWVRA